jgi:hypothetical protein
VGKWWNSGGGIHGCMGNKAFAVRPRFFRKDLLEISFMMENKSTPYGKIHTIQGGRDDK